MSTIALGNGDWGSVEENIARIVARNVYLTENPISPDGLARVSRPTLTRDTEVGSGTIYAIWREDGAVDGDWLVVSGEQLFRVDNNSHVSTLIGALPGVGYCEVAGSRDRVIFARNGSAWATDGTTITEITLPDDQLIGAVAYINGMFLLSVDGSDIIYWLLPGETEPDALHFITDERSADAVVSIVVVFDEIWVLGASGSNVYQDTGDANARIVRIAGRAYADGCRARATAIATSVDSTPCAIWVTSAGGVRLATGSPARISSRSEEELIRNSTNLRAWSFHGRREDFYVLSADQFTLVYNLSRKEWYRWDSYGHPFWRAHLGIQIDDKVYAGDAVQGILWELVEGADDDGQPVVREVTGYIPGTGEGVPCDSVHLCLNVGWGPSYDASPSVELRYSDDGGFTWTDMYQKLTGKKGQYWTRATFRSLGTIERPGRYVNVRFSEIARFRVDYAVMNEE